MLIRTRLENPFTASDGENVRLMDIIFQGSSYRIHLCSDLLYVYAKCVFSGSKRK